MPLRANVRESPEPKSNQKIALIIKVKKTNATKVDAKIAPHIGTSKGHNKAAGENTLSPSDVTNVKNPMSKNASVKSI